MFGATASTVTTPRPPEQDYLVSVVCESADKVAIVRFGPKGARLYTQVPVGLMPSDAAAARR